MADNQSIFDVTGSLNIFRWIRDGELRSFPINIEIRELISGVVASMCFLDFRLLAWFAARLQSRSVLRKIGKIGVVDKRVAGLDTVVEAGMTAGVLDIVAGALHNRRVHRKTVEALGSLTDLGSLTELDR